VQVTNPAEQITPRQLQVLRVIAHLQKSRCYSPTIAEVAEVLSISRPTAFEHIAVLREKRLLAGSKGKVRSLKLTARANRLLDSDAQTNESLPLAGRIAAGLPLEAIETRETLSLYDMFGPADDLFILQASGDSMIDEGIADGDYVVCRRSATARDGQIVVAIIDDNEATLKKFYVEPGQARLEPANIAYDPIYSDNCRIEAIVLGLLRRL
jgi:repressor LexA